MWVLSLMVRDFSVFEESLNREEKISKKRATVRALTRIMRIFLGMISVIFEKKLGDLEGRFEEEIWLRYDILSISEF